MSNLQPEGVKFELGGREFFLLLTLSGIDKLQEKYGTIDSSMEEALNAACLKSSNPKDFAEIFKILIDDYVKNYNEDHDDKIESVSADWIMRRVNIENVSIANKVLFEVFGISLPQADGTEKNTPAE